MGLAPYLGQNMMLAGLRMITFSLCLILTAHQAECSATHVLIAVGLGGNEKYALEFEQTASASALHFGKVSDDVTLLLEEAAGREAIQATLSEIRARLEPEDILVLLFVGHGSYDGENFRFNVRGPDFTAEELASWLEPVPARRQLVVFTGSSSGAVHGPLERTGRSIISATKSGEERNATVFGQFFVAALEDSRADINKDQYITATEAFQYASHQVDQYYSSRNTMATEHPMSKGPEALMVLAYLGDAAVQAAAPSPLLARLKALERDIAALKVDKSNYTPDDYFEELQRLLLELAFVEIELKQSAVKEVVP